MKVKDIHQQLAALKIAYEDSLLKKAPPEEVRKILQQIDEMNRKIALMNGDRLH